MARLTELLVLREWEQRGAEGTGRTGMPGCGGCTELGWRLLALQVLLLSTLEGFK